MRVLALCFLLFLSSPVLLDNDDRIINGRRREFIFCHTRKWKAVCARRQVIQKIWLQRRIFMPKYPYQSFLNVLWQRLILQLRHWTDEGRNRDCGRGELSCWVRLPFEVWPLDWKACETVPDSHVVSCGMYLPKMGTSCTD